MKNMLLLALTSTTILFAADEPKAFDDLIKGAKTVRGLFSIHETDEKAYLEIRPEQLNKPFLLFTTEESGIGEQGFNGSQMGYFKTKVLVLERRGPQVFWRIENTGFTAQAGLPVRNSVDRSFASSLLGTSPVEGKPHPTTNAVLVDLGKVFLTDILDLGVEFESVFRQPYKLDPKTSYFSSLRANPETLDLEAMHHFMIERIQLLPLLPPGAPSFPDVPKPMNVPDRRSILNRVHFSIRPMPDGGYKTRLADDRIGHFFTQVRDFSSDTTFQPEKRFVDRWRLEKQDPNASLSKPRQPIVYWLDKSVPTKYRAAMKEGALWWNKAFERIGFQDAIEIREQPEDSDWHSGDADRNTIRWFVVTDGDYAIGHHRSNPMTGEILNAQISISEGVARGGRFAVSELVVPATSAARPAARAAAQSCRIGEGFATNMAVALADLQARGLAPDSPLVEAFVQDMMKELIAHEVGHTLGLMHNFRSSALKDLKTLMDPKYQGPRYGSVMDYTPFVLPARQYPKSKLYVQDLGPYDYLAIEYAYRPLPPASEQSELNKIAARTAQQPELAFGNDADAPYDAQNLLSIDPDVQRWDWGSNSLDFIREDLLAYRDIRKRMEEHFLRAGANAYQSMRHSLLATLSTFSFKPQVVAGYIGGSTHRRVHFGDPGSKDPFEPVPAEKQRQAMKIFEEFYLAKDSFDVPASLLNRADYDHFQAFLSEKDVRPEVPLVEIAAARQKEVLDMLFQPVRLNRLVEAELRSQKPFRLGEMFESLDRAIWDEVAKGQEVTSIRRTLGREHLRKLMALVLRGGAGVPEDARSLARKSLLEIQGKVRTARQRSGLSAETSAYLSETAARIDETLKAQVQRTAF